MANKFTWSNMPVPCPVSQDWGENPEWYLHPPSPTIPAYPGHNGIDFGCQLFTPGEPIAPGRVDKIGSEPAGFGLYLRVWHAEYKLWSYYAHLSSISVKAGQSVEPGNKIYNTGDSGWATGPHLHLGTKVQPGHADYKKPWGGWVNPMAYYVPAGGAPPIYPPPVQPPEVVTGVVLLPLPSSKYRVVNPGGLNVRSSPYVIGNNLVGRLDYGDTIQADALGGSAFLRVKYNGADCYCAIVHQDVIYLEPAK